jgi:hypothetical protein
MERVEMARTIIGNNGVYNLFSSISDMPIYESGLTITQLFQILKEESDINNFDKRIARVNKFGTSSFVVSSLEDDVCIFLENNNITLKTFIKRYLTIFHPQKVKKTKKIKNKSARSM